MIANQTRPANRLETYPDLFVSHRQRINRARNYTWTILALLSALIVTFALWASMVTLDTIIFASAHFEPDYVLPDESELPATVDATKSGTIDWIGAKENDNFESGAVLAKLDSSEFESERAQLQIQNQSLSSSILNLQAGIEKAERSHKKHLSYLESQKIEITEQIDRRENERLEEYRFAQLERKLAIEELIVVRKLQNRGAVTKLGYHAARSKTERLRKELTILSRPISRQPIKSNDKKISLANEKSEEERHRLASEIERLRKDIEQNEKEIQFLNQEIESTKIRAPYEGIVFKSIHKEGNWANAGEPLLRIAPAGKPLVKMYVKTSDIGSVSVGNRVDIFAMSLDYLAGEKLTGIVARINPLPVDLSSGAKSVQCYEVLAALNEDEIDTQRIRLGVNAECQIHSDEQFTMLDRFVRYFSKDKSTTPVFSRATRAATASM